MKHLILAIATGLYVGKIPKAPGTWGSAAAFIPWLFFKDASVPTYLILICTTFIVGFFAAGSAEKILDRPDAGPIVIDEILGMFIALFLVPDHYLAWIAAFVLFRIFDITKPFPVSWFDQRIHGGIGIMMDDVIAGLYAFFLLHAGVYLVSIFLT